MSAHPTTIQNITIHTTHALHQAPVATGRPPRRIQCPACRQQGSTTDCTEQLRRPARPPMTDQNDEHDEADATLYAVVTFAIPVRTGWETLREQALRIHDTWLEDPAQMLEWLEEHGLEFDLQIHLPSEVTST